MHVVWASICGAAAASHGCVFGPERPTDVRWRTKPVSERVRRGEVRCRTVDWTRARTGQQQIRWFGSSSFHYRLSENGNAGSPAPCREIRRRPKTIGSERETRDAITVPQLELHTLSWAGSCETGERYFAME